MSDQIGVFIDGDYLLKRGAARLARNSATQRVPHRFRPEPFKNTIRNQVKRIAQRDRILRIYWYEKPLEDPDDERQRRLSTAKNGIVLRDVTSGGSDSEESDIQLWMLSDLQALVKNQAVSDVLIVCANLDHSSAVREIQNHGVRVHLNVIDPISPEDSVDSRALCDTFSILVLKDLANFLKSDLDTAEAAEGRLINADQIMRILEAEGEMWELEQVIEAPLPMEQASRVAEPVALSSEEGYADVRPYVQSYVQKLSDGQIQSCVRYWNQGRKDVPTAHDKNVLAACRGAIERNLYPVERQEMRAAFQSTIFELFEERGLTDDIESASRLDRGSEVMESASAVDDLNPSFERAYAPSPRTFRSSFDTGEADVDEDVKHQISDLVELYVSELNEDELLNCLRYWETGSFGVPSIFDKGVMAVCRQELNRHLYDSEKFFMRSEFKRVAEEVAGDKGLTESDMGDEVH